MKWIRKCFFEILAGILGVAFAVMLLYYAIATPEDLMTRGTLMFTILFDGIALYFVLRRLWRTKWRYRVLPAVHKALEKLSRVFKIVAKKLGIKERTPQTVLGGKSKIFFDGKREDEKTKHTKKKKSWKAMQNDKERLGYLYKQVINDSISHGSPVFSSETPSEIKKKKTYRDIESQIFDLYIENRYKDDVNLDTDTLDSLKKDLKNAKD